LDQIYVNHVNANVRVFIGLRSRKCRCIRRNASRKAKKFDESTQDVKQWAEDEKGQADEKIVETSGWKSCIIKATTNNDYKREVQTRWVEEQH
jgi:hypothetical protein